ncbi:gamma-glutamyltransferase family protein [Streptomyces sp. NBC_00212]|uniref:gamma-glutamyltransferase family protein n=1 Tax=Streptomyces sp. NBC_00212 TaxID=2975684 RepID=UPI003249886B
MVAAASPLAARAGCEVLQHGGTAADAAVTVQAVLAVVEPQSSGLGRGAQVLYWDHGRHRVRFFDGLAQAPAVATAGLRTPTADEQRLGVRAFDEGVEHTGRAVGVPGTVRVLGTLHRALGRLPWGSLFGAGERLAAHGFPAGRYLHTMAQEGCAYPDVRALYCPGGTPVPVGARVVNPELASVLKEVAAGGADAFYTPRGRIAPSLVARAAGDVFKPRTDSRGTAVIPSLMTVRDIADYRARERAPLCGPAFGYRVCTAPAPAFGGIDVLSVLALADRKAVATLTPGTLRHAHLLIESGRLAGVDARACAGDPDFGDIPVAGLLSPSYLKQRAAQVSPGSAVHPVRPGLCTDAVRVAADHDATSQVSIVDGYGNALSMTTTVNQNFGAALLARGMVLNNALTNFAPETAGGRNLMEPRKRPTTSMAPTLVFDPAGRPRLVAGSAGGGLIPDYVAHQVLDVLVHGLNPHQALIHGHLSGQTTTDACAGLHDARSDVEQGTAAERFLPGLRALGHPCAKAVPLRSGAALVEITPDGTLLAAADPRRDGAAAGG